VLSLKPFLEGKRVSELQEFHTFWAEKSGSAPGKRDDLLADLSAWLRDQGRVGSRLRLLAEKPLLVLHLLVRAEGFAADLPGLVRAADGAALEGYEVEAAARALGRRGFLDVVRDKHWTRYGREVYAVPRELAETVSVLLMEDRRGPRQVFTLAGHLEGLPQSRLRRLLRARGVDESLAGGGDGEAMAAAVLGDARGADALAGAPGEEIRRLLVQAAVSCGGIVPRARYEKELGAPLRWQRKRWQRWLEDAGLGTVTTLGLSDCGIEMEGETTVIFAEVVERVLLGLPPEESAAERVASARVDLLTDVSHFLRFAAGSSLRVTHGRTLHRAAYGRILEGLTFREDALVDRGEVLQVVYDLAHALGLVEPGEDRVLRLTRAGQGWDGVPLPRKVRLVYDRFLEERRPDHRDFHERPLRRLLAARLAETAPGAWVGLRVLPFLARNDYLAGLEEQGVRAAYRNRFQQDFDPPRVDPQALAESLAEWTVRRLYLLGLVDVGFRGNEPASVRLTEQGRRLLGGEGGAGDASLPEALRGDPSRPLVVNPDFEVLLLPEGDVNEVAHTLDRFARRVRSDEVTRYRLQREDVERAVVAGMTAEEMLAFLEARARAPVPQNVAYSVKEWAGRVRFARQRDAVLLEVDREDALDRALTLEPVKALLLARLGPTVAALRAPLSDPRVVEALKALGVYLRS
jgi:hypothetical protein